MEIFLSWSGPRSKACAEALASWLPKIINAVQPWISSADIDKGSRWGQEVSTRLSNCKFGIVCLTPENLHNDWILFEAGAISKSLDGARTCTFLIDLSPSDVSFPLAQFQHTQATKTDLLDLLKTVNKSTAGNPLSDQHLNEALEVWWPRLEAQLKAIPAQQENLTKQKRSDRALLEEILGLLRDRERTVSAQAEDRIDRRNQSLLEVIHSAAVEAGQQVEVSVSRTGNTDQFSIRGTNGFGTMSMGITTDTPFGLAAPRMRNSYLRALSRGFELAGDVERAKQISSLVREDQRLPHKE